MSMFKGVISVRLLKEIFAHFSDEAYAIVSDYVKLCYISPEYTWGILSNITAWSKIESKDEFLTTIKVKRIYRILQALKGDIVVEISKEKTKIISGNLVYEIRNEPDIASNKEMINKFENLVYKGIKQHRAILAAVPANLKRFAKGKDILVIGVINGEGLIYGDTEKMDLKVKSYKDDAVFCIYAYNIERILKGTKKEINIYIGNNTSGIFEYLYDGVKVEVICAPLVPNESKLIEMDLPRKLIEMIIGEVEEGREEEKEEKEEEKERISEGERIIDMSILYSIFHKKWCLYYSIYPDQYDSKYFDSFEELKEFLKKGKAKLYVSKQRTNIDIRWDPIDLPAPKFEPDSKFEVGEIRIHLIHPGWSLREKRWNWYVEITDRETGHTEYKNMSENDVEILLKKARKIPGEKPKIPEEKPKIEEKPPKLKHTREILRRIAERVRPDVAQLSTSLRGIINTHEEAMMKVAEEVDELTDDVNKLKVDVLGLKERIKGKSIYELLKEKIESEQNIDRLERLGGDLQLYKLPEDKVVDLLKLIAIKGLSMAKNGDEDKLKRILDLLKEKDKDTYIEILKKYKEEKRLEEEEVEEEVPVAVKFERLIRILEDAFKEVAKTLTEDAERMARKLADDVLLRRITKRDAIIEMKKLAYKYKIHSLLKKKTNITTVKVDGKVMPVIESDAKLREFEELHREISRFCDAENIDCEDLEEEWRKASDIYIEAVNMINSLLKRAGRASR